jgi:uncharacterized membrane protein
MKRFRPLHGIALVLVFVALGVLADHAFEGGFGHSGYETVRPEDGTVALDVSDLGKSQVRYYRFLNYGNQEVKFFVGRDQHGTVHVAFDASESHSKLGRGFRHEGDWMVDNKCDSAVRLDQVNEGGKGCTPVPLPHRLEGERVVLAENDILRGWRYFR